MSAVIGDCCDINDKFISPMYYRENLVAEGFYSRPFDLRKEYRVNDKGFLEVYFGADKKYPVKENMRINERDLGEHLKDETKIFLKKSGRKIGGVLDVVKDFGYEVYEGITDGN